MPSACLVAVVPRYIPETDVRELDRCFGANHGLIGQYRLHVAIGAAHDQLLACQGSDFAPNSYCRRLSRSWMPGTRETLPSKPASNGTFAGGEPSFVSSCFLLESLYFTTAIAARRLRAVFLGRLENGFGRYEE